MALAQAVVRSYFQSRMVQNWFRTMTTCTGWYMFQPCIYMLTVVTTPDFFMPERLYLHKLVKCQARGSPRVQ